MIPNTALTIRPQSAPEETPNLLLLPHSVDSEKKEEAPIVQKTSDLFELITVLVTKINNVFFESFISTANKENIVYLSELITQNKNIFCLNKKEHNELTEIQKMISQTILRDLFTLSSRLQKEFGQQSCTALIQVLAQKAFQDQKKVFPQKKKPPQRLKLRRTPVKRSFTTLNELRKQRKQKTARIAHIHKRFAFEV